jgi:hypothetical protein
VRLIGRRDRTSQGSASPAKFPQGVLFRLANCEDARDAGHLEQRLNVIFDTGDHQRSAVRKKVAARDEGGQARAIDEGQVPASSTIFVSPALTMVFTRLSNIGAAPASRRPRKRTIFTSPIFSSSVSILLTIGQTVVDTNMWPNHGDGVRSVAA